MTTLHVQVRLVRNRIPCELTIEDELAVVLLERRSVFDSAFGKLQWLTWECRKPCTFPDWNYERIHQRFHFKLFETGYALNRVAVTRRLLMEIPHGCSIEANEDGVQTGLVSYWLIVNSLILVSACLLISQLPRSAEN